MLRRRSSNLTSFVNFSPPAYNDIVVACASAHEASPPSTEDAKGIQRTGDKVKIPIPERRDCRDYVSDEDEEEEKPPEYASLFQSPKK